MDDKATMLSMEMNNGEIIQLTLTFARLYKLRQRRKKEYEKYSEIAVEGIKDELDVVTYLYTAYLCANIDNLDKCMTEEEFLYKMPSSHMNATLLMAALKTGGAEKKQVSGEPLKEEKQGERSGYPNLN